VTAFQSTVDELLTQKLQMLGGAAADENDSDVNRKLIIINKYQILVWLLL